MTKTTGDDEDQAGAHQLLPVVIIAGAVVASVYALLNAVYLGIGTHALIGASADLALLVSWWLLRSGRLWATSILLVATPLVGGCAALWLTGAAGSVALLTLSMAAVLAGHLLGPRSTLVTVVTAMVGFIVVMNFRPAVVLKPVAGAQLASGVGVLGVCGLLVVAGSRSTQRRLRRSRVEREDLQVANAKLARRVDAEQTLAGIGRLLVQGEDVDTAVRDALLRLHEHWGQPLALFVRSPSGPRCSHRCGFADPLLVGGDDEVVRVIAQDGGVVVVRDGGVDMPCRAVPVSSGAVPLGLIVAVAPEATESTLGDGSVLISGGSVLIGDGSVLTGAAVLLAAAFDWRDAAGRIQISERRRGALTKSSSDGLLILNAAGIIVEANPAASALFGVGIDGPSGATAPLVGRSLSGIENFSSADQSSVACFLSDSRGDADRPDFILLTLKRANGSIAAVEMRVGYGSEDNSNTARFDVALREVTGRLEALRQREALEQQLYAARRLEALGQLAGGIAHDFNNLLSVILTNARLMIEQKNLDDVAQADLAEIVGCGNRAADLTSQLLTFARQQKRELEVVDINDVVRGVERLLRRLIPAAITLELKLDPVWEVSADASQLEQVLVNLIANARDAMPDGGRCLIATRNVDAQLGHLPTGLPEPGRFMELSVTDSGAGMDDDTRSRVFEPFFTTKPMGKGVGLGLATVYGIVKQSAGHITVESNAGGGTTFRLWLPEHRGLAAPRQKTPSPFKALSGSNGEKILVVDDDEGVLRATERALSSRGFRVLSASSATAALALAPEHLDAVVADLVMPGAQGDALVRKLRARQPNLPAILLTGYGHPLIDFPQPFCSLRKPVSPEHLAAALRSVIDHGSSVEG